MPDQPKANAAHVMSVPLRGLLTSSGSSGLTPSGSAPTL